MVAPSVISAPEAPASDKQAVLYTTFKAHDAAVTALAVLKDEPGGQQQIRTPRPAPRLLQISMHIAKGHTCFAVPF